ncbi:TrbC/VirB2 family protein [Herbaspirillum sp. ST 5-3]|uniref:TrbC/VirB2 family protein n=1 Tax=Oxalobacteraceae TaxID=75682 RepID=UPI0010A2C2DF|nr:TrbC/VirB2 family protein [Herbaspirillum sp. ST 5-3]
MNKFQSISFWVFQILSIAFLLLAFTEPAFAQINAGQTLLENIKTWLTTIGALVVTLALMFVGFRMAFQAAEWKDVAPVFWGGVLIGAAATVAPMFITQAK